MFEALRIVSATIFRRFSLVTQIDVDTFVDLAELSRRLLAFCLDNHASIACVRVLSWDFEAPLIVLGLGE